MESYPPDQVTPYGVTLLNEGFEPLITYVSPDKSLAFYVNGGLAPWPGVTEGIVLADGMKGMHPTFTHLDHKGARQAGTTWADTVYDPAEMTMEVIATARTPEGLRKVIRKWIAAWNPEDPGTLSWVTPDGGEWWCRPRLFRAPPEKMARTMARSKQQMFTWSIRNDDAFWRSHDSTSTFQLPFNTGEDLFQRNDSGTLGSNWSQTYSGAGAGVCETDGARAGWTPSGILERTVVNRWTGVNAVQTVAVNGSPATTNFSFGGFTTGSIAHPATTGTLQTALQGLTSIGSGNVSVTGSTGGPFNVNFIGSLASTFVDLLGGSILTGGTNPFMTFANTISGAPSVSTADSQVVRFRLNSFYGWPWPTNARLDLWGRMNTAGTTGIRLRISGTDLVLSRFNAGVETVMTTKALDLAPQRGEEWRLVSGASTDRHFRVLRGGFPIIDFKESGTGSAVGASYRGAGWGMRAGAGTTAQDVPPTIEDWGFGNNSSGTASGYLPLTNVGDQEAFPDLVVYGPGTFTFGDGPGTGATISFGPLVEGQAALIRTQPGERGVHDLTGVQTAEDLPFFQNFLSSLFSFADNNNVPNLLSWFTSFFNIDPPQGNLYSLLSGRWSKGVPPRPLSTLPTTSQIAVTIAGGTAESKVIASITPKRRWPE